nr:YggS family pyridoxal phosphate-dependent enzyme [Chitinophagaceae bacterium]
MGNYEIILSELEQTHTRLIAVSKTKSVAQILELYQKGQRAFGENKVQELLEKYEQLPKDIEWHLIGHLQSNKVKYIIPFVHLIHSVDSLKLLFEINKEATKNQKVQQVLIQIHLGNEETKFGVDEKELIEILEYYCAENGSLQNVAIVGLMGMATNTDDEEIIRTEFLYLRNLFRSTKNTYLLHKTNFVEISMGMSSDYKIALEAGSTLIRVGSLLFGSRT